MPPRSDRGEDVTPDVAGLPTEDELSEIRRSLSGMRFGTVLIVVQDGVIVQIDRTEKRRLRNGRTNGGGRDSEH